MAKRKPYEKSKATRRGATVYSEKQLNTGYFDHITAGDWVVVGKKQSALFGGEIEVYGDSSLIDSEELSPYSVTADLGLDLIAQINDGYTIKPNYD